MKHLYGWLVAASLASQSASAASNVIIPPPDVDPASVTAPALAYSETPAIAADYDKYFYFHRAETGFAEALADVRECDAFARGLSSGIGYSQPGYPYAGTLSGAVGGAIGNLLVSAIFGSAEKRRLRRINMRTCMNYKGYARYGLEKSAWETFNFEEGLSGVSEAERQTKLAQ